MLIPRSGKKPMEERLETEASYQSALERKADELEALTGVRPALRDLDPKSKIYTSLPRATNHGHVTCISHIYCSESSSIGEVSELFSELKEQLQKSREDNEALQRQLVELERKNKEEKEEKEEIDERVRKQQDEIKKLKQIQEQLVNQMMEIFVVFEPKTIGFYIMETNTMEFVVFTHIRWEYGLIR